MTDERPAPRPPRDNIYTPSAGSMIVHLQREGGLASRTIVFTKRQVRFIRLLMSPYGVALAVTFLGSWLFFAVQAARVPTLTRRLVEMSADAERLDTLQLRLEDLQRRYARVQGIMSAGEPAGALPTRPTHWPLPIAGYITRATEQTDGVDHNGVDIAVPVGTEVNASGAGVVAEVGESSEYGHFVRLTHADQYESFYGHLGKVLVVKGTRVPERHVIATSGNTGRSTAPHLHFEIRLAGRTVDPLRIVTKRGGNGDVR